MLSPKQKYSLQEIKNLFEQGAVLTRDEIQFLISKFDELEKASEEILNALEKSNYAVATLNAAVDQYVKESVDAIRLVGSI